MLVAEYSYETDIEVQREEAWNAGITQGISQGVYEKAIETARGMVAKKIQIAVISEITGLSVSEIKNL